MSELGPELPTCSSKYAGQFYKTELRSFSRENKYRKQAFLLMGLLGMQVELGYIITYLIRRMRYTQDTDGFQSVSYGTASWLV